MYSWTKSHVLDKKNNLMEKKVANIIYIKKDMMYVLLDTKILKT